MSKKNKIVYSEIQPNPKEAGIWVNTNDGNVKVEKDGKWVDDGGSSGGGSDSLNYYKIDWDAVNESDNFYTIFEGMLSSIALTNDGGKIRHGGMIVNADLGRLNLLGIAGLRYAIDGYEGRIDNNNWLLNVAALYKDDYPTFMDTMTKCLVVITKEEFYNIEQ